MASAAEDLQDAMSPSRAPRRKARPTRARRMRQINEILTSFAQEISNLECPNTWGGDEGAEQDLHVEPGEWDEDADPKALEDGLFARLEADDGLLEMLEADAEAEEDEEVLPPQRTLTSAAGGARAGAVNAPTGRTMDEPFSDERRMKGALERGNPQGAMRSAGRGAPVRPYEEPGGIFSSGLIQAMVQDYHVMQANLRDYETSLQAALLEVHRLRSEVTQMECVRNRVTQLQELLANEAFAHKELHQENADLAARNNALMSVICGALEAEGNVEMDAFLDALLSENSTLWKLIQVSKAASKIAASSAQALSPPPRPQRPSTGTWSRNSSGSMSRSPPSAPVSPGLSAQQAPELLPEEQQPDAPEQSALSSSPAGGSSGSGGSPRAAVENATLSQAPLAQSSVMDMGAEQMRRKLAERSSLLEAAVEIAESSNLGESAGKVKEDEETAAVEEGAGGASASSAATGSTAAGTAAASAGAPPAAASPAQDLAPAMEVANLDDEEMLSEVSSLVESAIFLGADELAAEGDAPGDAEPADAAAAAEEASPGDELQDQDQAAAAAADGSALGGENENADGGLAQREVSETDQDYAAAPALDVDEGGVVES
mmetsp:Transcript_143200/g.252755  ORF Transcript_143200/g.252755 Transcript_143200/m.252755 type:complete len:605 (+) Transcript_143200:169-1983(+)